MKLIRQCETCEFYGIQIVDGIETLSNCGAAFIDGNLECNEWGASLEYYSEITDNAPWYIRKYYNDNEIYYDEFLKRIDDDETGKPVPVNIYDAILEIYGITMIELAELLNVTVNVVLYAKSRGTVAKRVTHFSQVLCIPVEYFNQFSSHKFDELEKCKEDFYSNGDPLKTRETKMKWKEEKLIPRISDCLSCNYQFARKFYTISELSWSKGADNCNYSDVEQDLIKYIRHFKREMGYYISDIEYKIDGRGIPKLEYRMLKCKS